MSAEEWSIRTWKERHEKGYFPESETHRNWRVYDDIPDWMKEHVQLTKDDNCLEIGCGYGEWMIPLSRYVGHVHGFDIHPAPIHKCIDLCVERGITNVSAQVTDGKPEIPFPFGSFSLVYSISVFQHLPREMVQKYLEESTRVIRLGGHCIHHFRNMDHVGDFPQPAKDIEENHTGDFSCGWTADEVCRAAQKADLRFIEVHDIGLFLILVARA